MNAADANGARWRSCKRRWRASASPRRTSTRSARRGFARFSVGRLGQHMQIEEPRALVRVARGRRVAEVSTTDLDEASLVAALESAAGWRHRSRRTRIFPASPARSEAEAPARPRALLERRQKCDAERRVALLVPVLESVRTCGPAGDRRARHDDHVEAVATTQGLARATRARSRRSRSGRSRRRARAARRVTGTTPQSMSIASSLRAKPSARSTTRCVGRNPIALPAGEYDAVLEPPAVAELIEWLSFIGFGAREFHQGASPLVRTSRRAHLGAALTVRGRPTGRAFRSPRPSIATASRGERVR